MVTLAAMLLAMNVDLQSQEGDLPSQKSGLWPGKSSWITAYVGYVGVVVPLGLNYEFLKKMEKVHLGFSLGPILTFVPEDPVTYLGAYSAFVFLSGTKDHHFEGRLGASVHPFQISPEWQAGDTEFPFIPVVTIGYRYQPPGSRQFFRVSFGTGGIGLGMGFKLGE